MRERTRQDHDRSTASPSSQPGDGGDGNALRTHAAELLARGSDAIDRALSTDSSRFLQSMRQTNGQ